jgi:FkbH-like protein
LEGDVRVRDEVREVLWEMDARGILHSIASRGVENVAMKILEEEALHDLFVFPRINWLPKPANIVAIAQDLKLSIDSMAFVEDDPFELAEAAFMLPDLLTVEARRVNELLTMPELMPNGITHESRSRRAFYRSEERRRQEERLFSSREDFLKSCAMRLGIRTMVRADIPRILELMSRTHQLNTTGRIMPGDELLQILHEGKRAVYVAELTDRFGSYGIIGAAVLREDRVSRTIEYLAISCRVLGRGIERAFIGSLAADPKRCESCIIQALFRDTGRNREMRVLFQMMNFESVGRKEDGTIVFAANPGSLSRQPSWIKAT